MAPRPPLTWSAMSQSAFPQATGVLQAQPTQQAALLGKPVTSESELRAALGEIASRFVLNDDGNPMTIGGSVVIAAPFKVRDTIVIPEECVGTTIWSPAKFPISASEVAISSLFEVRAEMITFRDLFVYGSTAGYFTTFVTNAGSSTTGRTGNFCRLLYCDVFTDRVYVDASSGDAHEAWVIGCRQVEANSSHSAPIVFDSPQCRVIGCILEGGGGDSVTVGANAQDCHIGGNVIGGGDITTTTSGGNNTVTGNTNCGTLTLHADDEEAANTP